VALSSVSSTIALVQASVLPASADKIPSFAFAQGSNPAIPDDGAFKGKIVLNVRITSVPEWSVILRLASSQSNYYSLGLGEMTRTLVAAVPLLLLPGSTK
jgi:hypothetical protein